MSKSVNNAKSARKSTVAANQRVSRNHKPGAPKPAANANVITSVVSTRDGGYVMVTAGDGRHFERPARGDSKEFRAIAQLNSNYDAASAWNTANPASKPQARLANGIGPKDAPHSAKAVADQKTNNAKAAPAKATGKGKARADKAPKAKAPARGVDRDYTVGKTAIVAKPDTWRGYMLGIMVKHTNTAKAKAAHAKSGKFASNKLDFNWANAQGYITFAK
jgi:hypothetical protein